ncbi:MAG TPA: cytochrome P450 [Bryobacteraceae bacterium]|nr:cytochrome P450 [Bryobacteraceae bacterium]
MTASAPVARGPRNLPILGSLPAFRAKPISFLMKVARGYGDLPYFRLGSYPVYLLNHPDVVKEVLVTQQSNFIKSRALQRAKILLGEGLLTSEGGLHKRQRRLVQPAFHRERLAAYADVMTECALKLRDCWTSGSTLDVSAEMMRLTLAVVGKTLFSADVESEASEIGDALTTVLKMFNLLMMPFSEYLEKLPLPSMRRFEKARARLDKTIYGLIRERRESGRDTGDLLSMLLLAQDQEGDGGGMSDQQVRDEALTLFLAGHETTANALTWTWFLLSQNPECERQMQAELDEVLQGRAPIAADLPSLRYTEMVLAEAMRLYPPAWAIGRMALESFELRGTKIAAGSILIASPYVMHRDSRWFPDPQRFDPQRWTPEARDARPKFSYFPFGGGARVCIGERFAWMEGMLVLAALAQKWKLRLVPGHKVDTLPLITLRTRYGMKMTVESRR